MTSCNRVRRVAEGDDDDEKGSFSPPCQSVTFPPMAKVARGTDVEIELEDADPSQRRRPSDGTAAAAVKDAVKEAAQNKVTNSFGYQVPDLVGTPGTFQTIAQIWLFF